MFLHNKIKLLSLLLISILNFPMSLHSCIKSYKITDYYAKDNNENIYLITREFFDDDQAKVLAIDIKTFNTVILSKDIIQLTTLDQNLQINELFLNKPIVCSNESKAIYLTIDLCPSTNKGFEKDLFIELINYGNKYKKTINIGIALTAKWAIKHPKEFNLLKYWHNNKDIMITWINHSYSHFYDSKLPNNFNFMLHDINNYYKEIISNEIYMIQNGLTPSIFFRFPGLVYNDILLHNISKLNLVALDCDAWLVKTKGKFKSGSIILLHGNKNEKVGIDLFLRLLKNGKFDNYEFRNINTILLSRYSTN